LVLSPLVLFLLKLVFPHDLGEQARIYELRDDSPAASAGLKENTNIVSFYSQLDQQWVTVNNIKEVQDYVDAHWVKK
jgi:hypothetical protein